MTLKISHHDFAFAIKLGTSEDNEKMVRVSGGETSRAGESD